MLMKIFVVKTVMLGIQNWSPWRSMNWLHVKLVEKYFTTPFRETSSSQTNEIFMLLENSKLSFYSIHLWMGLIAFHNANLRLISYDAN